MSKEIRGICWSAREGLAAQRIHPCHTGTHPRDSTAERLCRKRRFDQSGVPFCAKHRSFRDSFLAVMSRWRNKWHVVEESTAVNKKRCAAIGRSAMRKDIQLKTEDGVTLRGWHYLPDGLQAKSRPSSWPMAFPR
jgi:hypothetical protein